METNFNYKSICQKLLRPLPERSREVISRRFGLISGEAETLEAIGKDFGITRERVRQIEEDGFKRMKEKLNELQPVFAFFSDHLRAAGGLKQEDLLLEELGGKKFKRQVFFLLNLAGNFKRFAENKELHPFWTLDSESSNLAQKAIDFFKEELSKNKQPIAIENYLLPFDNLSPQVFGSYLRISKIVQTNEEGLFGLRDWPEINPRGIKDKAYLALKKANAPLHFSEVAKRIGPTALPQTVHNELIKDPRFVLVGRGLYALRNWGYEPGVVKEVIGRILKEANQPLTREEVVEAVLKQRFVKENTIALNLSDKRYFQRTPEGKYTIRQA